MGSLSPAGPAAADEAWARRHLLPGEDRLWVRMSGPDRRHAVGVARDAIALLRPEEPPRAVVAAALLHDVGKLESGLGTFARVGVTVAALAVGRERIVGGGGAPEVGDPSEARDLRGPTARWAERARAYLTHDRIGGTLLRAAGADDLTAAWAEEHHLPENRWSIDRRIAAALKAADGD